MRDTVENSSASAAILRRFCRAQDGVVRYAIEPAYLELLARLGNPQKKLPPVIHVAGTNGKGSTCAFLRAMLEAAGLRVHVYTSPHLVHFHERIRVAGNLIGEEELAAILGECERLGDAGQVSDFEVATAAAFTAFARHPADATILEVGMGGRLDATNVIDRPAVSVIARLSYDHCKFLGDTLTAITREKAGVMKQGVRCYAAPQPETEAIEILRIAAEETGVPLFIGGIDWRVDPAADGKWFRFTDSARTLDLPAPALAGAHQFWNAGLAIAALAALPFSVPQDAIAKGLRQVEWPARLQNISESGLAKLLPAGSTLWLDGGHNDSAGEVLGAQLKQWRQEDGEKRPISLVFGMLTTKKPRDFLAPMAPYADQVRTIAIPDEALAFSAQTLAAETRVAGFKDVMPAEGVRQALSDLAKTGKPGRVLICGSLYLAGHVLRLIEAADNKKPPR